MSSIDNAVLDRTKLDVRRSTAGSVAEIREALEQDGYAVVKGAFSAGEIAQMRDVAKAVLALKASPLNGGLNSGPAATESPLAHRLLNDPRLAPFYACEGPYEVHVHADTYNDWHRDLPPAQTMFSPASPAAFCKIAIYLQDHPFRDGLSVIAGSHKDGNGRRPSRHIGTRAGDIIVFDMRLSHAGRRPSQWQRLVRNLATCLYRVGLLDYRGQQLLMRRLRLSLPQRHSAVPERLAIFIGSTAAYKYQVSNLEQVQREHENKARLLRPPTWATMQ